MALRLPVQVRRAPGFDAQVSQWEQQSKAKRGEEAKKAGQRLKEVKRLEALFPRKPFLGRNVPKKLIPKRFTAMGVTNVFRNDLPDGWRLLHTLLEVDGQQAVIELVALSHPDYDDLFGYEGR
ncbi:MAG: hypothetical protein LC620_04005 [Halobacteriales archaeon]|nr:hypothetical protein [Halobacteriales archaeon]